MQQEPLFDADRARANRDISMKQVTDHAAEDWKTAADLIIHSTALRRREFTADDLWQAGLSMPFEPRALGPRLTAAAGRGEIVRTDRVLTSTAVMGHGRNVRVWKSLIYSGPVQEAML